MGTTRSPATPNGSRLVARTVTDGHPAITDDTNSAAAGNTCSQLSRINNNRRPRSQSTMAASIEIPACGYTDNVDATPAITASESGIGASSNNHTPSGNASTDNQPASIAVRVLPTPPVPVSVTNRRNGNSAAWLWRRSTRPTYSVANLGRFPGTLCSVFNG